MVEAPEYTPDELVGKEVIDAVGNKVGYIRNIRITGEGKVKSLLIGQAPGKGEPQQRVYEGEVPWENIQRIGEVVLLNKPFEIPALRKPTPLLKK
ncbi:MAG: PRC-barrel domain-containing protein [Euryarchaeota archaeon]|nr:PRC-barrel domain-containing protein [Euryarchaeota archaeon]